MSRVTSKFVAGIAVLAAGHVAAVASPVAPGDATGERTESDKGEREGEGRGQDEPEFGWDWVLDSGLLPFAVGSGAVAGAFDLWVEPPDEPRGFDPAEGGARFTGDTLPNWTVGAYGALGAVTVAAIPRAHRWRHLAGLAEAYLTTMAVTTVTKNLVGRHRPHFDPEFSDLDQRRSFFSGHSSLTAATSVYLSLYLHGHVFGADRIGQSPSPWEVPVLTGVLAAPVLVGLTRIQDNRHHPSDVVAGLTVGSGISVLFYSWHERKLARRAHRREKETSSWMLVPDVAGRGVMAVGAFD